LRTGFRPKIDVETGALINALALLLTYMRLQGERAKTGSAFLCVLCVLLLLIFTARTTKA